MLRLHQDTLPAWFTPPPSLARLTIDPRTGKRVPDSPAVTPAETTSEWCPRDRPPLPVATTDYDAQGRALLGAEYREWLDSAPNADHSRLALAAGDVADMPLRILAPRDGATYYLDPELPSRGERLRLATNLPGLAEWSSPTLAILPTTPEPTAILVPGTHVLTATDPRSRQSRSLTIHVQSL